MRISKNPEERKAEILDVAERLFTTKGYNKTTISDILDEISVARGTLYYHFKSKEEMMDAIIMRIVNANVAVAKAIAHDDSLSCFAKILQILFSLKADNKDSKEKIIDQLHKPDNAEMHQKSLVMTVLHIAPILSQVVEQGVCEGVMAVEYPYETVELLLASAVVIFDGGLFPNEKEILTKKAFAFVSMAEAALGTKKGDLSEIVKLIMG
ncbi:MAG: TetR/AcrR family transcriptional regulator [Defluviitaleaceae bacterium]|nr:TetR/AcrR family transcriptional regulator [Defluviitaleaceae bacterium]